MFRLLVLSVVCAVAFANPAHRERRQANCLDAFKNVPNPCVNNPQSQVYFPHPTDNTKFIQCDRYGRMYIIQCPENLIYSSTTSTCRQQATSVITQGTTMAPMPGTQPAVVNPVNPNNPCTPEALAAGNIYFAVKGDETKFIECDMLGHANVLPCSSGLVWNEGRLSCVYKFVGSGGTGTGGVVGTGGTGTNTGTGTGTGTGGTGTGTGTGSGNLGNPCTAETIAANKLFFPHPDSTKFIQCDLWGDVFVVSCPAGLVWNQFSETCASAFVNVGGSGK